MKPATEEVSTQTDLTPEILTLRKTPGAFGKTSFTQGAHQFFQNADVSTSHHLGAAYASFRGGGSFLGDRGRQRILNRKNRGNKNVNAHEPPVDLNDENYDGAPVVVEDDPIGFDDQPIAAERPPVKLGGDQRPLEAPMLSGGYSRTGGELRNTLHSQAGPDEHIPLVKAPQILEIGIGAP